MGMGTVLMRPSALHETPPCHLTTLGKHVRESALECSRYLFSSRIQRTAGSTGKLAPLCNPIVLFPKDWHRLYANRPPEFLEKVRGLYQDPRYYSLRSPPAQLRV